MGQKKRNDQSMPAPVVVGDAVLPEKAADQEPVAIPPGQALYDRVVNHLNSGHYTKALDLLRSAGREPRIQNAIGVCLMRLRRTDDALRVYRELVLAPGGMGMKRDAPVMYKVNYGAALLLAGQRAGCLDVLAETGAKTHPSVQRLRAVIKEWERSLSFWQRLNWRFGQVEPGNAPVTFATPPGELDSSLPDSSAERL
jgi:hypothetical protein